MRTRCGNQARHLAETAEGDSQPQEKETGPGPSVREADKKLQLTHLLAPKQTVSQEGIYYGKWAASLNGVLFAQPP